MPCSKLSMTQEAVKFIFFAHEGGQLPPHPPSLTRYYPRLPGWKARGQESLKGVNVQNKCPRRQWTPLGIKTAGCSSALSSGLVGINDLTYPVAWLHIQSTRPSGCVGTGVE